MKLQDPNNNIKLSNLNDTQIVHFLKRCSDFLLNDIPKHIDVEKDIDLINIRDELLTNIHQALYLFTLD
jgi:hypothetical protein